MVRNFILFLMVIACLQVKAQNEPETAISFPGNDQFAGWQLKDSIQVFSEEELYEHVNESAGLFSEFGFNKSYRAVYRDSLANKISLDVFLMNQPDAAWGAFTMNSSGKGRKVEVGNVALLYDYHLHFVKGNYYIKCISSNNDPEFIEELIQFATFMASEVQNNAKEPAILSAFQLSNITPASLKFFKGQIGLNDIFEFGHGSIAGFEQGGSCRFQEKMYFVFAYSTERKRREWFASARGKMNMNQRFSDYTPVEDGFTALDRNGTVFSFKPFEKFILVVRGYSWKEAQPVFTEMGKNLNEVVH